MAQLLHPRKTQESSQKMGEKEWESQSLGGTLVKQSAYDRASALMNIKQMWLHAQDLNKSKVVMCEHEVRMRTHELSLAE